jgi:prepilin-type processing-associated H-X9-DG protein
MDAGLDYATGQALAAKHAADPTWWQPDNTYRINFASISDGLSSTIGAGDMHNILKGYTTTMVNNVSVGSTPVPSCGRVAWGQRPRLLQRGPDFRADEYARRPLLQPEHHRPGRSARHPQPESERSFRSTHPHGCNFLFCDGSVKFVRQSIDTTTYRTLGSRNGSEVVGDY